MSWWATVKASAWTASVGPAAAVLAVAGGAALVTDDPGPADSAGSADVIAAPLAESGDSGNTAGQVSCTNEGDTGDATSCVDAAPLAESGDGGNTAGQVSCTNEGDTGDATSCPSAEPIAESGDSTPLLEPPIGNTCSNTGEDFSRFAPRPDPCDGTVIVPEVSTTTTTLPSTTTTVPPTTVASTTPPITPPPTAPPCTQFDIQGVWVTEAGNGYHATFDLHQIGKDLDGTATLPAGEYERAGYKHVPGTVVGTMIGDQVILDVTWLKADEGALTGRYTGTVSMNRITGSAGTFSWTGTGTTTCIDF